MANYESSGPIGTVAPSGAGGNMAADLISQGAQLLQIRTEKQLLVAVQRPRDEEKFERKLLAEAAAAGEDFFYSIPYKNHVEGCQDRGRCKCPETPVEGAGVGLARSAARLWGNCSVETIIEQDLPDAWIVGAWFVDFETNYTKHEAKRISKMKFLRGGRAVKVAGKELDVVYQQGASKVERDVILRALPKHVVERSFETAKAAALQEKAPVAQQIARLVRKFAETNVPLSLIESYLGSPFTEAALKKTDRNPVEVCAHLRGILTAIKGGEVTLEDVFGEAAAAATSSMPATAQTSGATGQAAGGISKAELEPAEKDPRDELRQLIVDLAVKNNMLPTAAEADLAKGYGVTTVEDLTPSQVREAIEGLRSGKEAGK